MKVLFISGYSDEFNGPGARSLPPRAFLGKPFGLADFLRSVRETLDAV